VSTVQQQSREDRFTDLAGQVVEPLHRYARRRTDPDTAQDVVADALLVIWRRLDDVPTDDPLPWCYAVARRCLANTVRSARRRHRLVVRLASLPSYDESPGPGHPGRDAVLDAALRRLPDSDQELLRLWAWEDLAPREIAVVLGISANASSIRLHRARRRLAALLGKDARPDGQEQVEKRRAP